jgi:hypothetical protein
MAEVNTDIYKTLGQNNQQMTPLQILQLVGAANQNKLFNQTYESRDKIGQAWKNNVGPDGKINNEGLMRDVAGAGFLAPEAAGQAISNSTNQFTLDTSKLKFAQSTLSALAGKKDLSAADISNWSANAARAGVPTDVISGILDSAHKAKNTAELRKAIATQGIMSMGTGALEGEPGTPTDEGTIPQIPKGQAIIQRTQPGGMVTTNPPGYQEAATSSAGLLGSARNRAATFGSDIYPMMQALPALEKLGPQGTGPGTGEFNTVKSFIQSNLNWLPGADKVIGDPNNIKNFDEATKYLTNIAGARAGAFGHGTDQALSTALTASPNTHISNLAAVDLTKATIALRRMEQAQTLEADAKNVTPGKFATWASRWATNVDPRAFMVDLMTPDQLQNLNKTLKNPAERQKFNKSVQAAIDHGIITRPGGEHAPGE